MNLEVGLSANGLMAAVAQADGVIEFKNAQTGQVVGDPRRLIRQPRSIAISPDGLRVFAAFENDVGILHISQNSDEARLAGHLGTVEGVAVSGDGRTAASLSRDNTIRLWNSDFPLYEDRAFGMAFTADGNRLTAISHRGIRVWDVETDSVISGPDHLVNAGSTSLPFSRDGRLVAVGSGHGKTEIWNVESRERVAGPFAVANDGYVTRLALTEDGKRLAIGSGHGFQIWDVDGNQAITPVIDVDESIDALAFSPDGRSIVSDRAGGALQVWDVSTGRPSGPKLKDKQRQINSLKFSPDGRFVAAGDYSGTLQIWDVSSAKPVSDPVKYRVDAQNSDAIGDIAFTPDGRRIATAGRAGVRLWDAQTGYPIGPIISPSLTVHTVVFSRDERLVATGASDGSVRFWPSPSSADPATLCAKLVTNMTRTQWQKWVGEGFAYRKTCKNLPDPAD